MKNTINVRGKKYEIENKLYETLNFNKKLEKENNYVPFDEKVYLLVVNYYENRKDFEKNKLTKLECKEIMDMSKYYSLFDLYNHVDPFQDNFHELKIKSEKYFHENNLKERNDYKRKDIDENNFIVENVFSKEECDHLIKLTEDIQYEGLEKVFEKSYRNNQRLLLFSEELSTVLYQRIKQNLCRKDILGVQPMCFGREGTLKYK
jgi:hypothetical protein